MITILNFVGAVAFIIVVYVGVMWRIGKAKDHMPGIKDVQGGDE